MSVRGEESKERLTQSLYSALLHASYAQNKRTRKHSDVAFEHEPTAVALRHYTGDGRSYHDVRKFSKEHIYHQVPLRLLLRSAMNFIVF